MGSFIDGASSVAVNLVSSALIVILVWFKLEVKHVILLVGRRLRSALIGTKYVLVWNDDTPELSAGLVHQLADLHPTRSFRILATPSDILEYPLTPQCVEGIVLIDCDVTSLAETAASRQRVEQALERYLVRGGGIVGTHDLIYRRTRATTLQRLFGCQINWFVRQDTPVSYCVTAAGLDHAISRGLPEVFMLEDGEICWGSWAIDTDTLFETDSEPRRPLVVCRDVHQGRVVWLNSADRSNDPAPSVSKPSAELVRLLSNSLDWFNEARSKGPKCEAPMHTAPLIVAHRGLSGPEHENRLEAIRASLERGVEAIEIDVRRTKDGMLVVNHDADVEGLTISATTHAVLSARPDAPPLLDEVLTAVGSRCVLDVEIKEAGYEHEIAQALSGASSGVNLVLTSFEDVTVARLKKLLPGVPCGLLLGRGNPRNVIATRLSELMPLARLRSCHADFVAPAWQLLHFGFLARMHAAGYPVHVWTVDDPELMDKLCADRRVAAIITNVPQAATEARERLCTRNRSHIA
jgi:glycerophosphoryl diester phosphodiesterase